MDRDVPRREGRHRARWIGYWDGDEALDQECGHPATAYTHGLRRAHRGPHGDHDGSFLVPGLLPSVDILAGAAMSGGSWYRCPHGQAGGGGLRPEEALAAAREGRRGGRSWCTSRCGRRRRKWQYSGEGKSEGKRGAHGGGRRRRGGRRGRGGAPGLGGPKGRAALGLTAGTIQGGFG